MARKIIQVVSDNFFNERAGQYCGIIALCDDGTLWTGKFANGEYKWYEVDTPFTKEGTSQQPATTTDKNNGTGGNPIANMPVTSGVT